eukprot:962781-Pelagomonas_calceolata.AAC.2
MECMVTEAMGWLQSDPACGNTCLRLSSHVIGLQNAPVDTLPELSDLGKMAVAPIHPTPKNMLHVHVACTQQCTAPLLGVHLWLFSSISNSDQPWPTCIQWRALPGRSPWAS